MRIPAALVTITEKKNTYPLKTLPICILEIFFDMIKVTIQLKS